MEIWEKVRRFLLFWLAVLAVLVAASLIVHGGAIVSALAASFQAGIASLITLFIVLAVFVWIFRSIIF